MHESDFDKSQMAFYREVPDMVVKMSEWETIRYCANCEGILDDDMPCMHGTAGGRNEVVPYHESPFAPSMVACPHCKKLPAGVKVYGDSKKVNTAPPIAFKLIRRRKIYTKVTNWIQRLFGDSDKFFYEYTRTYDGGGESD